MLLMKRVATRANELALVPVVVEVAGAWAVPPVVVVVVVIMAAEQQEVPEVVVRRVALKRQQSTATTEDQITRAVAIFKC